MYNMCNNIVIMNDYIITLIRKEYETETLRSSDIEGFFTTKRPSKKTTDVKFLSSLLGIKETEVKLYTLFAQITTEGYRFSTERTDNSVDVGYLGVNLKKFKDIKEYKQMSNYRFVELHRELSNYIRTLEFENRSISLLN